MSTATATADQSVLEEIIESLAAEDITSKIDREAGVIRDVLILARDSRNGREYSKNARRQAVALYEGQQVHTDHDLKAKGERSEATAFGELRNVHEVELAEEVRGDLHYLKSHQAAERIIERAERKFRGGLSHHTYGDVIRKGGKVLVESLNRCLSVDYVLRPATTVSLFESEQPKLAAVVELAEAEQPELAAILTAAAENDTHRELVESRLAACEANDATTRLGAAVAASIAALCSGDHADGGVALIESLRDLLSVDAPAPVADDRVEQLTAELKTLRREQEITEALAEFELAHVPKLRRAELLECETVEAMHARIAKWPITQAKQRERRTPVESVLTESLDGKAEKAPKAVGTPLHERFQATATKDQKE